MDIFLWNFKWTLYIKKQHTKFHKDLWIQSEDIQILLDATEFPTLTASLSTDAMSCLKWSVFELNWDIFMKFCLMFFLYIVLFSLKFRRGVPVLEALIVFVFERAPTLPPVPNTFNTKPTLKISDKRFFPRFFGLCS